MTQPGETDNFSVSDHVKLLNKYLGKRKIDVVLASNTIIRKEIIDNSLETFLILVLVVCIVYYGYLSIKGGWNVYSNPL